MWHLPRKTSLCMWLAHLLVATAAAGGVESLVGSRSWEMLEEGGWSSRAGPVWAVTAVTDAHTLSDFTAVTIVDYETITARMNVKRWHQYSPPCRNFHDACRTLMQHELPSPPLRSCIA